MMPKTWSIEDYEILAGDFLYMWRMYVEENDNNLSENARKLKRIILGIMWRTLVDLDDYRQDQAKADFDKALRSLDD